MSLNTIQTFNLKGSLIVSLYSRIMKLQRLHRATTAVKVMLADDTVNLGAAVTAIQADPDYAENPATVLAAKYDVEGYLLTEEQVPATMTVEQVGAIRPFIAL